MSPSRKSAPSAVVGLDIGSDSIKVVEARYAKDGITITGLGIAKTPEGAIENEVIVDPQALGKAIKTLMSESGIKTKKCVSSVSGQSRVVVRVIEVPKMNPKELADTMKWQVESQVPFSPDDIVMDFQPIDRPGADPDAQNMEILLAVAQQELIDSHVATLFAAGLKPMAIDIQPLAASRSLIDAATGAKQEIAAIINIGSNNTDMGIYEDGVLAFPCPPVGIAGISFTREIAESLAQTLEQAEITKKEYAAVDIAALMAPAPEPQPEPVVAAAEPTTYDAVDSAAFGGSAFNFSAPATPEAPETPAEPAAASEFTETFDGPVFGAGEQPGAPAFDLGGFEAPGAPSFDLGAPQQAAKPVFDFDDASAEPIDDDTIDIGGSAEFTPDAGPVFDLAGEEPEPAVENAEAFGFGFADAGVQSDFDAAVSDPAQTVSPANDSIEHKVFSSISGVLVDLASELRRSIEYYSTRYARVPEKIYLCGGTAKMPKLAEYLSSELGIPVVVADPVHNVNVKAPGVSEQYLRELSPLFSVSIGLAIRDMIG